MTEFNKCTQETQPCKFIDPPTGGINFDRKIIRKLDPAIGFVRIRRSANAINGKSHYTLEIPVTAYLHLDALSWEFDDKTSLRTALIHRHAV
jgi:hypothetical protein